MNELITLELAADPRMLCKSIVGNPRCLCSETVHTLSRIYLPSLTDLDMDTIKVSHGELREQVLISIAESTDDVSLLYMLLSALDHYILSYHDIRFPDDRASPVLDFSLSGFMQELMDIDRYLYARCRILYARRSKDYTNIPSLKDVSNDITQVPVIATQFLAARPAFPVITYDPFRFSCVEAWHSVPKTWIVLDNDAEYAVEFCREYLEYIRSAEATYYLYGCMKDEESSTIYSGFYSLCYSLMTPEEQVLSGYTPPRSDRANKVDTYILSGFVQRSDMAENEEDPLTRDIYDIIEYYTSDHIEYHFHAADVLSMKAFAAEIEPVITDEHFTAKALEASTHLREHLPRDNFISKLRSQSRKTSDTYTSLSSSTLYILMHAAFLGSEVPDWAIEQIVGKLK